MRGSPQCYRKEKAGTCWPPRYEKQIAPSASLARLTRADAGRKRHMAGRTIRIVNLAGIFAARYAARRERGDAPDGLNQFHARGFSRLLRPGNGSEPGNGSGQILRLPLSLFGRRFNPILLMDCAHHRLQGEEQAYSRTCSACRRNRLLGCFRYFRHSDPPLREFYRSAKCNLFH